VTESVNSILKNSLDIDPIFKDIDLLYETYYKSQIIKFIIDPAGIIKSVNKAFQNKVKKSDEQLLGTSIYAVFRDSFNYNLKQRIRELNKNNENITETLSLNTNLIDLYELTLSPLKNNLILGEMFETNNFGNSVDGLEVLKSLFESLPNAVIITDPEGYIEWVNEPFTRLTQYNINEIRGKSPRILKSHVHDFEFYKKMWQTLKSGKIWEERLFNKRKDGSIYLDEQKIIPYLNYENEISHFIAFKTNTPYLFEGNGNHLLQENLFNNLDDAVTVTDTKYNVMEISSGAKQILEICKENIVGENFFNVIPLDLEWDNKSRVMNILNDKQITHLEIKLNSKTENKKLVELTISDVKDDLNNLTGHIIFSRTKNNFSGLLGDAINNENFFSKIFDSISESIIIYDRNFRMKAFNQSALKSMDMTQERLYNKRLNEVYDLPDKYIKRSEDHIREVFNDGKIKNYISEYEIEPGTRIFESVFFPITDADNNIKYVGLIFKDVTTSKSSEDFHLKFEKLAAIGKMAAYISHEMKTPLNSIKMNIDMLSNSSDDDPIRKKSFQLLQKEVKRLSRLMNEVLQYSSANKKNIVEVSIYKTIEEIKFLLNPLLEKKSIVIENHIEDTKILAAKDKLETVFYHLIENSIEAIEENGKIILSSDIDKKNKEFIILIKDSGCGIANPDKVYEPFFTTKKKGTGLGLSIIKNVLEANNAKINLISSSPGNTTFELRFPII
jgi:PAS domain S-box-containing protein